jgi:hypothetical protein
MKIQILYLFEKNTISELLEILSNFEEYIQVRIQIDNGIYIPNEFNSLNNLLLTYTNTEINTNFKVEDLKKMCKQQIGKSYYNNGFLIDLNSEIFIPNLDTYDLFYFINAEIYDSGELILNTNIKEK